jgi:hypothetical protein
MGGWSAEKGGIFNITYVNSKLDALSLNIDGTWQMEYSNNIAIFDIR